MSDQIIMISLEDLMPTNHIYRKFKEIWKFGGDGKLSPTTAGAPQGGIISPTLLTITLNGLEQAVKAVTKPQDKINICVYADDFIITGAQD